MQNLTQKQDFLSKQILDQGYDPEEFQDFMAHFSNKQLDLNAWTIEQLKSLVGKFKSKNKNEYTEKQEVEKQIEDDNNDIIDEREGLENTKSKGQQKYTNKQQEMANISRVSVNSSLRKYFNFQKKTQLPQLYTIVHLEKKNISIKIRKYTKTVPDNIFKSSYIKYQIETSLGWKVSRRFSDFVWLQSYLKKKYLGFPVPPIPSKTTMRSFDEKHIEYRMLMFERFLGTLLRMPQACSDIALELFIKQDEQSFSVKKKKLQQRLQMDQGNTTVNTIWGNQLILIDQHSINPAVSEFYKQYSLKLINLTSQINILLETIKKASSQCFVVSSMFQELQNLVQKVPGNQITNILQQFSNGLGMHLTKTSEYIKNNIYSIWNYDAMYCQNIVSQFAKSQKQKDYISQKYKNAMVNIPQDDNQSSFLKQFQLAKQDYRIKLSYLIRQARRHQNEQLVASSKQWSNSSRVFIRDISDWMISCTDILTKSMSVSEGKKLVQVEYVQKKIG